MKRGIALCGGGSKGSYQMGVWTALRELGIDFDLATGTSIGSINAALMVQNDYEISKNLWQTITIDSIMSDGINLPSNLEDMMSDLKYLGPFLKKYKANMGADITPFIKLLSSIINEDKIRSSTMDYGLVTVNISAKKPYELTKKEIPQGKMLDYIIASASCFPAFPMHKIDDSTYIDGGYYDNLPIDLAVKMGAEDMVVVDLFNTPTHTEYINCPFVSHYICPSQDLGTILNFNRDIMAQNQQLGYMDTLKEYKKLRGYKYSLTTAESISTASRQYTNAVLGCEATIRNRGTNSFLPVDTKPLSRVLKGDIAKFEATCNDFYLRGAEICGELCGISPYEVYSLKSFNQKLFQLFKSKDDYPNSVYLGNPQVATKSYINGLLNKDKKYLLGCMYFYLKDVTDITAQRNLFMHYPTEFVAALYMVYAQ